MNPSFSYNGQNVAFTNGTFADYSTSVIGNISAAWLRSALKGDRPVMA